MLIISEDARERIKEVKTFLRKITDKEMATHLKTNFINKMKYLHKYSCQDYSKYTRCKLYADFAPLSFALVMEKHNGDGTYKFWFNGGLIYSGPIDVNEKVGNVRNIGWSVHT